MSLSTGPHLVTGAVRERWAALGWEAGRLGYPTGDTHCGLVEGGCYQHFQGGSLYGSASTPVRFVVGAVRDRWAANGWETWMGFPKIDATRTPDGSGTYTHFSSGASIYWSQRTGAHTVGGSILLRWAQLGWERGIGYPMTEELSTATGRRQQFQLGWLNWEARTGAVTLTR